SSQSMGGQGHAVAARRNPDRRQSGPRTAALARVPGPPYRTGADHSRRYGYGAAPRARRGVTGRRERRAARAVTPGPRRAARAVTPGPRRAERAVGLDV